MGGAFPKKWISPTVFAEEEEEGLPVETGKVQFDPVESRSSENYPHKALT